MKTHKMSYLKDHPKKLKIALCLYGLQGNLYSKSGLGNLECKALHKRQKLIKKQEKHLNHHKFFIDENSNTNVTQLAYNYWDEYFLSRYDVDIYIHSWEPDISESIIELYNPVKYKFENKKTFDIPENVAGTESRKQNHYSRWHSQFECNKLRRDSGIRYDFIMMSRFDMAWSKTIKFEELEKDILYYPGDYFHLNHSHKMQDLFHISQDKIMNDFCDLYNNIEEYSKLHSKYINNQKVGISSHRLSKHHVRKMEVEHDTLLYRRQNREKESDYTILRLLHELKEVRYE